MLAVITHGNEPSEMEITTRYELTILEATTETYVFVETKVHHHCTQIGPCGMCVHGANIGLITN